MAPAYQVRIAKLERRVAMLSAILRLVLTLLRISGSSWKEPAFPTPQTSAGYGVVDQLFDSSALRRVFAQIDVGFSNSLIEAWWRILKHQWLYLHTLDNLATVRKLVAFYVTQHNQTVPHSAFQGQTPDEMHFGRGATVPDELAARRLAARQQREATNRSAACSACPRAAPAADNHVAAWARALPDAVASRRVQNVWRGSWAALDPVSLRENQMSCIKYLREVAVTGLV